MTAILSQYWPFGVGLIALGVGFIIMTKAYAHRHRNYNYIRNEFLPCIDKCSMILDRIISRGEGVISGENLAHLEGHQRRLQGLRDELQTALEEGKDGRFSDIMAGLSSSVLSTGMYLHCFITKEANQGISSHIDWYKSTVEEFFDDITDEENPRLWLNEDDVTTYTESYSEVIERMNVFFNDIEED